MQRSIVQFLQYLYETARSKSKVEEKITSFSRPITNHLIKILKWSDSVNYHKHIDDIDVFMSKTLEYKYYKKKRPSKQEFYELLFEDRIDSIKDIDRIIKFDLKKYHKLPEIRTNQQVYYMMKKIMLEATSDLVDIEYKSMEYYVKKYS
jgi:hypothetical protein